MPVRIPLVSGLTALAALLLPLPGAALSVESESLSVDSAEQTTQPSSKREPDPIPPLAAPVSDAESMQRVPDDLLQRLGLQLVLDRQHRQLLVLHDGVLTRRFPAAVGTVGWETPAGRFRVMQKVKKPVWTHPVNGKKLGPEDETNPLGSRWIGFYRDCKGREGWDGEQYLDIDGCTVAGFHGTPYRWTVGRAVSHGCVRLYEENVQEVFELVRVGTPVTVLP
ncbi:L/D-transpeptidase catalytic domain protein [Synechococcus sp. BIOS-E4-1]|uniref:L,D-transpeptidase n=1 Tax=Synechococcus sp. BIOS-E4-1 TaxID=1400864 RepID=UPI0016460DD0|nr:L,D-transpeptidase [Synechococcus sp. BIOS-E4-1]QNI54281.1 L/D-transpeptidase catalytic domain protein [Synechococcus sp. BIOS-E4-1]